MSEIIQAGSGKTPVEVTKPESEERLPSQGDVAKRTAAAADEEEIRDWKGPAMPRLCHHRFYLCRSWWLVSRGQVGQCRHRIRNCGGREQPQVGAAPRGRNSSTKSWSTRGNVSMRARYCSSSLRRKLKRALSCRQTNWTICSRKKRDFLPNATI